MANSLIIDAGLLYADKTICVPVNNVTNNSALYADDVIVQLSEVPDGVTYLNSNLPRGTYDDISNIWNIGQMKPYEVLNGQICFSVADPSIESFSFTFTVGLSEYCDGCTEPTPYCVIVKGIANGLVIVGDSYDNDADAAANGVEVGQLYELSTTNSYGLPPRMIKKRAT